MRYMVWLDLILFKLAVYVRAFIISYCAERTSLYICNHVVALQHANNILTTLDVQLYPCSDVRIISWVSPVR